MGFGDLVLQMQLIICRHHEIKRTNHDYTSNVLDRLYHKKQWQKSVTNHDLLRYIGKHADEIIMSTGMSNMHDIAKACKILEETNTNISLLHCVSSYPTKSGNKIYSNEVIEKEVKFVQKVIDTVRSTRADYNLPNKVKAL